MNSQNAQATCAHSNSRAYGPGARTPCPDSNGTRTALSLIREALGYAIDKPRYSYAEVIRVGGSDRQHHRYRPAAWANPARHHAAVAAAGRTDQHDAAAPRGPPPTSHR